jgi:nucleoid DNA-binding protein
MTPTTHEEIIAKIAKELGLPKKKVNTAILKIFSPRYRGIAYYIKTCTSVMVHGFGVFRPKKETYYDEVIEKDREIRLKSYNDFAERRGIKKWLSHKEVNELFWEKFDKKLEEKNRKKEK